MRFTFDQDFHIHSMLSDCSSDKKQSTARILQYGEENGLKQLVLTDHFWDEKVPGASNWYAPQNYAHLIQALPLPQSPSCQFLFGCETDMDKHGTIGVSRERLDVFDFIVIPTTHLHMTGFTYEPSDGQTVAGRVQLWVSRLEHLLMQDLPFRKIGVAHLSCGLIAPGRDFTLSVLNSIPEEDLHRLFKKAAALGVGIELNYDDMRFSDDEADAILRPFRAAKDEGCLFYCGSDAHHPEIFDDAKSVFERAISYLDLTEDQKFHL